MQTLIKNPRQYVADFLGYKNSALLQAAIEINLAERFLVPDYTHIQTAEMMYKEFEQVQAMYKKHYPQHHTTTGVLQPLYYFHCVAWLLPRTSFTYEALVKACAHHLLQSLYADDQLQSKVAHVLVKRYQFLQTLFTQSNKVYAFPMKSEMMYQKMLAAMTLQHRELYDLEVERLENHDEYAGYNQFIAIIEQSFVALEQATFFPISGKGSDNVCHLQR